MLEAKKENEPVQDELDLDTSTSSDKSPKEVVVTVADSSVDDSQKRQIEPEETIEQLRAIIADKDKETIRERERANRLEGERNAEVQKATSAISDAFKSRESSIDNALTAAKSDLDSIKRQLREAREKGDIDAEIDLEEKLADTKFKYNSYDYQKTELARVKTERENAVKNAVVEQKSTARSYTSTEQAWIDENPRYNNDDEFQSFVWATDALAKKRGYQADTPAYYEFLNSRVAKFFPTEQTNQTQSQTQNQRTTSSAITTAAPPSRTSSTQKIGTNGRQIRLTPEQVEIAEFSGMTPAEYAEELIKIEQEKMGRA